MYRFAPRFKRKHIERLLKHKVFKILLSEKKLRLTWLMCSSRGVIQASMFFAVPESIQAMKSLGESDQVYIIRPSFSEEKMTVIPEDAKGI
ncbi:MAG: hypothetical protein SV375_11115 [Thermodesulfobacteriota bacterium]|nr:hypothetical protein [Thermodesulfobacteriota bacterium]